MPKSSTPSFIMERRIYLEPYQYDKLEKYMRSCNKIYNTAVKHYNSVIKKLRSEARYMETLAMFRNSGNEEKSKALAKEIFAIAEEYGLTEYGIHQYMGYNKAKAFKNSINIDVVQKLGTELYQSIKKALFSDTEIHYRKKGQTNSFEGKKANNAIIYNEETDTIKIFGDKYKLKPIRKTDTLLLNSMACRIKYCRIVRKPFKNKYKYFVQFVFEGKPLKETKHLKGKCGLDIGTSTVAYYNKKEANFFVLADGVERYEKAIKRAATKYERRLRLANPDCFNENGTLKKGTKLKKRTKGSQRALMELKNAYRLKSTFIKNSHNYLASLIASQCDTLVLEPMNFKALARKAKETSRQDKLTAIKNKDGITKLVQKFKRKKRFGKSIGRRAPGQFIATLKNKVLQNGGTIIEVDGAKYKASQYNHATKKATKPTLSCRVKEIDGQLVQRDLYSSYLLYNIQDKSTINFNKCKRNFNKYIEKQSKVIDKIKNEGDKTKNFGLSTFVA